MEKNNAILENIIKPYKVFEENKQRLIQNIELDYDKNDKRLVGERINNAIYILDSNPIDTKEYISNNANSIKDNRLLLRTEIEYLDYIIEEKRINKNVSNLFANYIKEYALIDSLTDNELLFNLDFEAFSLENNALLDKVDVNQSIKEDIINRRKEFKIKCFEAGTEITINFDNIEKIIRHKKALELYKKIELIKSTRWGRRIKKQIKKMYNYNIPNINLAHILLDNSVSANTSIIKDENNELKTVCYVPLISNINNSSLDRILMHELRHVSEINEKSVGISTFFKKKYDTLNEIRTEKNAIYDLSRMNKTLYSTKNNNNSLYERLFRYTNNFFDDNKFILDKLSINGDIDKLEELFDKNELRLFDYYLYKISESLLKNVSKEELPANPKLQEEMVEVLNNNCKVNRKRK